MKNQPYISLPAHIVSPLITKENPYTSQFPNRKQRRESLQKQRFLSNKRNYPVTIAKHPETGSESKWLRFVQYITYKHLGMFIKKRIEHTIAK